MFICEGKIDWDIDGRIRAVLAVLQSLSQYVVVKRGVGWKAACLSVNLHPNPHLSS